MISKGFACPSLYLPSEGYNNKLIQRLSETFILGEMKNWQCKLFSVTELNVIARHKETGQQNSDKDKRNGSYQRHLVRNELLG